MQDFIMLMIYPCMCLLQVEASPHRDGKPVGDVDGIPLNLDGVPLKGEELDGVPLAETALDGLPLAEEDIDGLPSKSHLYYRPKSYKLCLFDILLLLMR